MTLHRCLAAAAVLFAVAAAGCSARMDPKAQAVIDRTKAARQTYAVYGWERASPSDGEVTENWGVEFNSGRRHRVENPDVRIVADCVAGTGTMLVTATNRIDHSPNVAKNACGIATSVPFRAGKWLAEVDTPFGRADRIELTNDEVVRTYDITKAGVIVRSVFVAREPGSPVVLTTRAVAVLDRLPNEDMFGDASLGQSYVPDAYKVAPKP